MLTEERELSKHADRCNQRAFPPQIIAPIFSSRNPLIFDRKSLASSASCFILFILLYFYFAFSFVWVQSALQQTNRQRHNPLCPSHGGRRTDP